MTNHFYSATEAWETLFSILSDQAREGFKQPSRAGNVVGELLNTCITITDSTRGIVESPTRDMPMRYAVGELLWYLSGSNKLKDINKYSKFWNRLSPDGLTINSAYGYRIHTQFGFDQWLHVKDLLKADPLSRQAVIHIKDANPTYPKDTPCTQTMQFMIRNDKLHMSVTMRSNDIWLGFPFDVFCFTAMQVKMAFELGVDIGTYTHFVGSLHLYEKDLKLCE